jgi:hypothetical protein
MFPRAVKHFWCEAFAIIAEFGSLETHFFKSGTCQVVKFLP